jgi:hypothetical protein
MKDIAVNFQHLEIIWECMLMHQKISKVKSI